jgi:hypothetical protein
MHKDYVPNTDGGQLAWCPNLKAKTVTYATILGLTTAEQAVITEGCDAVVEAILDSQDKRLEATMARTFKQEQQKSKITKMRNVIARLKTSSGYTKAIGEDMGVVGNTPTFDPNTYTPHLRAMAILGGTRLTWVRGRAQMVKVFRRLKGQTTWEQIYVGVDSLFEDRTPLANPNVPEVREYKACGC